MREEIEVRRQQQSKALNNVIIGSIDPDFFHQEETMETVNHKSNRIRHDQEFLIKICGSLIKSTKEYCPKMTYELIVRYVEKNNRLPRVFYSTISSILYAKCRSEEQISTVTSNVDSLVDYIIDERGDSDKENVADQDKQDEVLSISLRIYDHVHLALLQIYSFKEAKDNSESAKKISDEARESSKKVEENLRGIEEKIQSGIKNIEQIRSLGREAQEVSEEAKENSEKAKKNSTEARKINERILNKITKLERKVKNSQKEYITILGIFASVVITLMGGMTFSSTLVSKAGSVSWYRLTGIAVILAFTIFNLLYMLLRVLWKIHKSCDEKTNGEASISKDDVELANIKMINIALAIVLLVIVLCWFFNIGTFRMDFSDFDFGVNHKIGELLSSAIR